jgi:hypothetical protein
LKVDLASGDIKVESLIVMVALDGWLQADVRFFDG